MKYFKLMIGIYSSIVFIFLASKSFANDCQYFNKIQNMIASVEKVNLKHNSMDVINEQTLNKNSFFVTQNQLKNLKKGDRIRIYYYCGKKNLLSFKKMTPVVFNEETANKGYVNGHP